MKNLLCAGAVAFAMVGLLSTAPAALASEYGMGSTTAGPSASIDIGRIHRVLNLTPAQERHWRPVEAALRQLAKRQQPSGSDGLMHRVSSRVVSVVLSSVAIQRLASAARPLISTLTDEQKQAAGRLAQEMGLGPVVMAALN